MVPFQNTTLFPASPISYTSLSLDSVASTAKERAGISSSDRPLQSLSPRASMMQ